MVEDRGNVKWTTLMLPEHAELLKALWREDKKTDKPILDPQEIESINKQLVEAYKHQHTVTLSIHENGNEIDYSGRIIRMDRERKCLIIHDKDYREIKIPFHSLIGLTID